MGIVYAGCEDDMGEDDIVHWWTI